MTINMPAPFLAPTHALWRVLTDTGLGDEDMRIRLVDLAGRTVTARAIVRVFGDDAALAAHFNDVLIAARSTLCGDSRPCG